MIEEIISESPKIKIYNANCLDVLKEFQDNSIDAIITDPPYMTNSSTIIKRQRNPMKYGKNRGKDINYQFGEWDRFESKESYYEFSEKWFLECIRIMRKGAHLVSFVDMHKLTFFIDLAERNNCKARQNLFWIKSNPAPCARKVNFMSAIEIAIWITKETISRKYATFNYQLGQHTNYIINNICSGNERKEGKHPTQKPIKVMEWIISYLTKKNDVVLDLFMGSGSTGIACYNLERNFIGIEKEAEYYQIAKERLKNYTKQLKLKKEDI